MTVITRFPPSPTGKLQIGNVRTALFNYLFARHHNGQFVLRIEDTDRERSTDANIQVIFDALEWLELECDNKDDVVYQFSRRDHHAEIAQKLLDSGQAYKCYTSKEELAELRTAAEKNGEHFIFKSPWRDKDPSEAPSDSEPVVRIKAPQTGETTISDLIQGDVTVSHDTLDDFILLRSDGTPTYMLSVVVDDYDMGVTHVIRGDDHLNNAFRQQLIYKAMGWDAPYYAHVPLILGSDGKKLSKRHGAVGVAEFKEMGILPAALRNQLLRLGWSHGDDEIISDAQAIEWFDLDGVNKSPAKLDYDKLLNLNGHYIRESKTEDILPLVQQHLGEIDTDLLERALPALQERAKTINDLAKSAEFYFKTPPLIMDERAQKAIEKEYAPLVVSKAITLFEETDTLDTETAQSIIQSIMDQNDMKMSQVGPLLRAALCGTMQAPDLSVVISILGKDVCLERLRSINTN